MNTTIGNAAGRAGPGGGKEFKRQSTQPNNGTCTICGDEFQPRRNRRHVCQPCYYRSEVVTLALGTLGYHREQLERREVGHG